MHRKSCFQFREIRLGVWTDFLKISGFFFVEFRRSPRMADGTTVSGGCGVTQGSGMSRGLEDAVSAVVKGKLESK